MTHPSDTDLDALEAALSEPDTDDLDENSERYLRAVQSLRFSYAARVLAEEDEVESSPLDDFEAAYERLREHIEEKIQ